MRQRAGSGRNRRKSRSPSLFTAFDGNICVFAPARAHTYVHCARAYTHRIAPENGKLTATRRAGLYNPEIKGVLYPESTGRRGRGGGKRNGEEGSEREPLASLVCPRERASFGAKVLPAPAMMPLG